MRLEPTRNNSEWGLSLNSNNKERGSSHHSKIQIMNEWGSIHKGNNKAQASIIMNEAQAIINGCGSSLSSNNNNKQIFILLS